MSFRFSVQKKALPYIAYFPFPHFFFEYCVNVTGKFLPVCTQIYMVVVVVFPLVLCLPFLCAVVESIEKIKPIYNVPHLLVNSRNIPRHEKKKKRMSRKKNALLGGSARNRSSRHPTVFVCSETIRTRFEMVIYFLRFVWFRLRLLLLSLLLDRYYSAQSTPELNCSRVQPDDCHCIMMDVIGKRRAISLPLSFTKRKEKAKETRPLELMLSDRLLTASYAACKRRSKQQATS